MCIVVFTISLSRLPTFMRQLAKPCASLSMRLRLRKSSLPILSFRPAALFHTENTFVVEDVGVCRVSLRPYSKRICFVTENRIGYKWIQLQSIEDIRNYSNEIRTAFEIACKQRKQYQLKHKKS